MATSELGDDGATELMAGRFRRFVPLRDQHLGTVSRLRHQWGEDLDHQFPMSDVVALLCKTDPEATPAHTGISILLVEKVPGFTVGRNLPKLGYKGVESFLIRRLLCSCIDPCWAERRPRLHQMMGGLEIGRIQVAARDRVARHVYDALEYATQRETFGQPIWRHQSVGNLLADMATQITAGQRLNYHAAERFDSGVRADLEAGMAKLFCSEMAAGGARCHQNSRRARIFNRV